MFRIKPEHFPKEVIEFCSKIQKKGFEAFIVGGAVRDTIINKGALTGEKIDYDITTNALPKEIIDLKIFKRVIETGIKHGTITILYKDKEFEVTTFRLDGDYSDSRHPDSVNFNATIEEDLKRRDFTINAMAYDPIKDIFIDNFEGRDDIEKRIIRAIGDPIKRFNEDSLRVIRMCRFAATLQFSVEDKTLKAVETVLSKIPKLAEERIRAEFMKMLTSPKPSIGLELMRVTKIMKIILPELDECFGVDQNKYHKYDIYYHSIFACDAAVQDKPLIRLSALFHDIGKKRTRYFKKGAKDPVFYNHEMVSARMTKKIMRRMRFSNKETKYVTTLIQFHMFHYTPDWTDGAVRRFIRKVSDLKEDLFLLRTADRIGSGKKAGNSKAIENLKRRIKKIEDAENAVSMKDLNINGSDIMDNFQLKEGRIIGDILKELLERILDEPDLNNKKDLLKLAGDYIKQNIKI